MLSWIPTVISGVITFGAGYCTHYLLVIKREAANRRRAFRGRLRSEVQKIEAIDLDQLRRGEVFPMQQASVAVMAEECANILDDIPRHLQPKFDEARRQYCALKREDVEPYEIFGPGCDSMPLVRNYLRGRERAVELLKRMIEYAA